MMFNKLEIQEIPGSSVYSLRLADNSHYITGAGNNAILEITPPGASCPIIIQTEKNFNMSLDSIILGLSPNNTYTEVVPLPDGVYKIYYSIAPNAQVHVLYYLFRNTSLMSNLIEQTCSLMIDKKRLSKREFESRLEQLFWIKNLIDGSKWIIENNGEELDGIELYNEAFSLLNKYKGNYPCLS